MFVLVFFSVFSRDHDEGEEGGLGVGVGGHYEEYSYSSALRRPKSIQPK